MNTSSVRPAARFSEKEAALLKLLRAKPQTTEALVAAFYGAEVPLNGRVTLVGRLNGIEKKMAYARDPRCIVKSRRDGPNSITWAMRKR